MLNFGSILLLTGAGFTANFGGFLAREMWSRIFSNPKLDDAGDIKLRLRNDFNFEDVYSDIFDRRNNISEPQVKIFGNVVNDTYQLMDNVVQAGWDALPIHHGDIIKFLDCFKDKNSGTGVCFTLNQDLVMEKRFSWLQFSR